MLEDFRFVYMYLVFFFFFLNRGGRSNIRWMVIHKKSWCSTKKNILLRDAMSTLNVTILVRVWLIESWWKPISRDCCSMLFDLTILNGLLDIVRKFFLLYFLFSYSFYWFDTFLSEITLWRFHFENGRQGASYKGQCFSNRMSR